MNKQYVEEVQNGEKLDECTQYIHVALPFKK